MNLKKANTKIPISTRIRISSVSGRGWRPSKGRQRLQSLRHLAAGGDQVGDQALIDIEIAFVLAQVAHVVAFRQYTPDFRAEAKRMRQQLENNVAIGRTIAVATQGSQAKCMGGVVARSNRPSIESP